jgi:DNA-binding CsgD family transcriptional regulator
LARLAAKPQTTNHSIPEILADRELEVFELTGRGLSTREIAGQLRIDVKTVDTYRARIREKLSLKSSSELLQLAIRWNQTRR